jgi:hypothetical protein
MFSMIAAAGAVVIVGGCSPRWGHWRVDDGYCCWCSGGSSAGAPPAGDIGGGTILVAVGAVVSVG